MQEIESFGSVTVVVSGSRGSAVLISHRPEELHLHQQDWDGAVRYLKAAGFGCPPDDPLEVNDDGVEFYVARPVVYLRSVPA